MAEVVADAPPAAGEQRACKLVTADGSSYEVAHGMHEAVSRLGRDDASLVVFELTNGGRLAVRREAVRQLHEP